MKREDLGMYFDGKAVGEASDEMNREQLDNCHVERHDAGESLGSALPREMARVRDEVLPEYLAIGPNGTLAVLMIRKDLDQAAKAMAEGDVVEMMRVYQSLKETQL